MNVRVLISGRDVQVTLRDTDETRLLARLTALLAQYPVPEASIPASTRERGLQDGAKPTPEGWCVRHATQMRLNNKEGQQWYSHHMENGAWCKGR